jgi:tRNA/tmRNA/rRNA uracil-C5-methylase (TrmA/RlmC/RlmD family)
MGSTSESAGRQGSTEQAPERIEVEIGPVAHGGRCVARHEGQVIFVRHALPGERVIAEITGSGPAGRYLWADAVEVLRRVEGRRVAPCPVAAACGGCDWQHATPATARALKTAVVREALARFARVELPEEFEVRELLGESDVFSDGLGWRTRGVLAVDDRGRAGFRAPRSHDVVVGGGCPQLDPRLAPLDLFQRRWPAGRAVRFVAPARGEPLARATSPGSVEAGRTKRPGPRARPTAESTVIEETAAGRTFQVAWDGFWQVHPGAADALVDCVRTLLDPQPGEQLVDLYSGVGLLGVSLAAACFGLQVRMVEGIARACELARENAAGLDVQVVRADVRDWLRRPGTLGRPELVVLDPPRTGAGADVVRAITAAEPRAIAYVACDPVALARDVATFAVDGYVLAELVGLDLFPTTHHVECIALLVPGQAPFGRGADLG